MQWDMAFVPPPGGGLGLPHLPTTEVVARASALLAACQRFPASEALLEKVAAERDKLIGRLTPMMCQPPAEVLGDLRSPPPERSAAKVSRKVWRSIHSLKHRQLQTSVARVGNIRLLENWKLAVGDLEAPGVKCPRCLDDCLANKHHPGHPQRGICLWPQAAVGVQCPRCFPAVPSAKAEGHLRYPA